MPQFTRWNSLADYLPTDHVTDTPITLHVTDSDGNDARTEDKFVQAGCTYRLCLLPCGMLIVCASSSKFELH